MHKEINAILIFVTVVVVMFFLSQDDVYARGLDKIVLISSKSGGNYQSFTDEFSKTFIRLNRLSSQVNIQKVVLADVGSTLSLQSGNTLYITVGSKAAKFVNAINLNAPLIHSMLPFSTYKKIKENKNINTCVVAAIIIDQPIKRQIELSKKIFPNLKKKGLFLGAVSRKRYQYENPILKKYNENIETIYISESRELAWSLRELSERSDVFIAVNDPLIFNRNNAKWLLYMAYQEGKPVIAFSSPYVSAGAAAAVYSSPENLAKQTAEQAFLLKNTNIQCASSQQYPKYFEVSINSAIVQSLSGDDVDEVFVQQQLYLQEAIQ